MSILHLRAFALTLVASAVAMAAPVISGSVQDTGIVNGLYGSSALSVAGGTAPYEWSIVGGALPPGLAINPLTGAIAGTPIAALNYNFLVGVRDNLGATTTSSQSIIVANALAVTPASLPPTTVSKTYSRTLGATGGGTSARTWSVASGLLPPGLTLNSAGTISGTPSAAGTYSFSAQVSCCSTGVAQGSFSIVVNPAPSISTSSFPNVTPGGSYSQALSASGGTGALTWSITAGTLPTGMTLNPSTGAIGGTANAAGLFNFSAHVVDTLGVGATQPLSIWVVEIPVVSTTPLLPVTVGQSVSASVAATLGTTPYTWSISAGSLPSGIALSPSGGLTGTPTVAGVASFTVRVADSNSQQAFQAFNWTVNARPAITTSTLPDTTVGAVYSKSLVGTGGTGSVTWSISSGSLPAGLSLNATTGAITGTTTAAISSGFLVALTDTNLVVGNQGLGIIVNAAPSVTSSTLPRGVTTTSYAQTLSAAGGTGALTWSISAGSLPPGLTISPTTGAITGTPTAIGTYNFTARVTDTLTIAGTQALSIAVIEHPDIVSPSLSPVTVSQVVSTSVSATAGTPGYTWSLASGSLPSGISLNPSTGALTGTPTAAGAISFTLKVTDSNSLEDMQGITWIVNAAPSISAATLPATTVSAAYSQTLTGAGGTGTGTWSVSAGSLPAGISLNSSSGLLSGSPTAAGTASFTISYTDTNSIAGTQGLSIVVNAAPTVVTTTLPLGVTTVAYSQTLASNGGTGAHTWSVSGGTLPAGLSLNASSGAITGTPATVGTFNFTVRAIDTVSIATTQALSLQVVDHPDIITTSFPAVTVGQLVSLTLAAHLGTPPYTWSISSGALPPGVSLNPSTGALTGTPTTGATALFTAKVTDANSLEDMQPLSWLVNGSAGINTTSLPPTTLGASYSQTLVGSGGTGSLIWTITSGNLPSGLSLNASTGVISGTSLASGLASFTISLADTNSIAGVQSLSILVNPVPSVTTTTLPKGVVPNTYSQTLSATGGTGAYVFSLVSGSLPPGLSLSPAGNITGTLTTMVTTNFTIRVTDPLGISTTRAFSLEVVNLPVITTSTLPRVDQGVPISLPLAATFGTPPYRWSITGGALPLDVTLAPAGVLTGAPAISGTFSFTATVTDANHLEDHRALTWTINPTPPTITDSALPTAYRNSPYFAPLPSNGGVAPRRWSLVSGTLPAGISLATDGSVSGTPTVNGTSSFTLGLTDAAGLSTTGKFSLEVKDRPQFRVSPELLSFEAYTGVGPAPQQQVEISSTPSAEPFTITSDHDWLRASIDRSSTPAVVNVIADSAGLIPDSYTAILSVIGAQTRVVTVNFTVNPRPDPSISAAPGEITISSTRQAGIERRLLVVHTENATGTIAVRPLAPWITVSNPTLSNGGRDAALIVTLDPSARDNGSYESELLISRGSSLESRVPVTINVAPSSFDVFPTGLTFDAVVDGSGAPQQQARIWNRDTSPLIWQAATTAPWVRLVPPGGTANPIAPLGLQVNTAGLAAGSYSSLVTITPQSGAAARTLNVRLNMVAGSLPPQVSPKGISFTAAAATNATAQQILLMNPRDTAITYVSRISPDSAASWLTIGTGSGSVPAGGTATLIAQTQSAGLAPGIYHANLTIEFADQTVTLVHVTLTMKEESCKPTQLVPVLTKLGDHFQIRAGWPATVEVLVADDCGQPVSDGSALVRFSDPTEPALALIPGPGGRWTATWSPLLPHTSISANVMVQGLALRKMGTLTVTGSVAPGGPQTIQQ